MFTVTYKDNSGTNIQATNIRSIDIPPQHDRGQSPDGSTANTKPQAIRLNAGIGGGGQLGAGIIIPIANVVSITVAVV